MSFNSMCSDPSIILVLVLIYCGSNSFLISSASEIKCAELRSVANDFQNQSLVIGDLSVLGNIPDEYVNQNQNWNVSGNWRVSSGCTVTTCQDEYLAARCQTFGTSNPPPTTSTQWKSASCKCDNQCSCSNVYLERSVCARAYFQSNGCNVCGAAYTEFSDSNPIFPLAWKDKIGSFLVRPGCAIEVYDDEDFEGESETIEGTFVQDWSGTIMSYECQCDEDEYLPPPAPIAAPRPNNYPANLNLPTSMNDLVSQLRSRNYNHPGLLAAFSSLIHGRSSKNAYILLIGSSGAGKSSCINNLLNNPNVTLEGVGASTTSEILEFRFPVPLDNLGILNSELRIIDTPGLGDTRGLQNDALFLATLDEYLSQHEELKTRIPNLVLVFHHFTDNRFIGEGAKFVKMVRGLSNLHNRITDENYSNVLFVFSHFCEESSRQLRRNPAPKLKEFKDVIEHYSLFPKPILTTVIENKGKANNLQMVNGNYELPNMEYFPANILNRFDKITLGGKDKLGRAIIIEALGEREKQRDFNMRETQFNLVSPNHSKVAKYLGILSSAGYNVENTEISQLLANASISMPTNLNSQFPTALEYLQKYFNIRNYRTKADLPLTTVAILELLEGIQKNEAVVYLLENGLKLKASDFPQKVVAAYSFNVLKDIVLPISPYKLDDNDDMKTSEIGFRLPGAIQCTKQPEHNFNKLTTFDTKQQYVQHMLTNFAINISVVGNTDIFTGFDGKIRDGYFVKDKSCSNSICSFVASRYFKLFQFDLNILTAQLSPDFIKRVGNLTAFDESNYESIDLWNSFFNDYGTHMVKSAFGGGRIDIHVRCPSTTSVESLKNRLFSTVEFAEDLNTLITGDKIDPQSILPAEVTYSLVFHGGSPTYHTSNLTALSFEDASKIMKNWKKSLRYNPVIYPIQIAPIHQAVRQLGLHKSEYIQEATLRLFNASLIYVPPTPDPKVVEELARQQREREAEIERLAAEKKAKEEQAERDRLAEIAAQKAREAERIRIAEVRRLAELERQRTAEVERQRLIKQAEDARKRAEEAERQRQVELAFQLLLIRIAEEARRRELERQIEIARNRRTSCLKQGTKVLLADFSEKPVEQLEIGDMLLDKDLKPTKVLGVSYEFLVSQRFYGFDNKSFFFTNTHLFVGPKHEEDNIGGSDSFQLYTTSKAILFNQNPLLEYLHVKNFQEGANTNQSTTLLYFDPRIHKYPVEKDIEVYLDPRSYSAETPIYFIQVDSPTGTYFAEGFVCRHEIPPLELWPNTMATLFSLFGSNGFEILAKLPYSLETISFIDEISDEVQMKVEEFFDEEFLGWQNNRTSESDNSETVYTENDLEVGMGRSCKRKLLESFNLDEMIGKIFNNPTMAVLGMNLYGGTGSVISMYLDNPKVALSECQISKLQERLVNMITYHLELSTIYQNKK
ncbi:unnamed protein product [Orchesella dallaii]|uniref:MACPF domain-containing protein n=1 Tax=Orchesella dallaii TaxID=48710 RepID=A0ABP1RD59_9HEXA